MNVYLGSHDATSGSIDEDGNPEDPVLTLTEILDQEEKLEETSNAVLGASDSQNCSYDKVIMLFLKVCLTDIFKQCHHNFVCATFNWCYLNFRDT